MRHIYAPRRCELGAATLDPNDTSTESPPITRQSSISCKRYEFYVLTKAEGLEIDQSMS